MIDFSDMSENVGGQEAAPENIVVDVSRWMGEGATITLAPPDVPLLWRAHEQQEQLETNNPRWPDSLCRYVALLVAAHLAPEPMGEDEEGKPIPLRGSKRLKALRIFYGGIAAKQRLLPLFNHLSGEYGKAFPDWEDELERAKKNEEG